MEPATPPKEGVAEKTTPKEDVAEGTEEDVAKSDKEVCEKGDKEEKKKQKKKGCNTAEVVGVLAHELGHWKLSHNLKNIVIGEVSVCVCVPVYALPSAPLLLPPAAQPALHSLPLWLLHEPTGHVCQLWLPQLSASPHWPHLLPPAHLSAIQRG